MNTLRPEPKKSTLGQFNPETEMRGKWLGYVAIACVAGSFVLGGFRSLILGAILAASAVVLGKLGLDSKGRSWALVALIAGMLLTGIYLTVLIVGKENIRVI